MSFTGTDLAEAVFLLGVAVAEVLGVGLGWASGTWRRTFPRLRCWDGVIGGLVADLGSSDRIIISGEGAGAGVVGGGA